LGKTQSKSNSMYHGLLHTPDPRLDSSRSRIYARQNFIYSRYLIRTRSQDFFSDTEEGETSFQTRYYHDYILHYNYHINKLHFQMST